MDLVLLLLGIIFEGEPKHGAHFEVIDFRSYELSLLKPDIVAILPPALLLFLEPFFRIEIGLHPPSEEALVLLEVADVDLVFEQLLPPLHLEIKPLQVA